MKRLFGFAVSHVLCRIAPSSVVCRSICRSVCRSVSLSH